MHYAKSLKIRDNQSFNLNGKSAVNLDIFGSCQSILPGIEEKGYIGKTHRFFQGLDRVVVFAEAKNNGQSITG